MEEQLEEKLRDDLKQAMLDRDEKRVGVLRLLLSELNYAKIQKGEAFKGTEDIIAVIHKAIKQRKESIDSFKKGGREDLVAEERAQLRVLEEYLPKMMEKEEIGKIEDAASIKFTIMINEQIASYLDWISEKNRVTRSAFIKKLIEDYMLSDKSYKKNPVS